MDFKAPLTGERCGCTVCREVFSGEEAFSLHRTGSYADGQRRCLSRTEIAEAGLTLRENGVWGVGEGHRGFGTRGFAGRETATP